MVWKLLSGIAAACLGVALYFAYISKNDIRLERELEKRAKDNLAEVKTHKEEASSLLARKSTQVKNLETDRDKLKQDVVTAEAESKDKSAALELSKKALEEKTQLLAAAQKQIDEAGDVGKLVEQVKALEKDKEAEDAEVAASVANIATLQEKLASVQKQTERLRTVETNSRKGVIEPTFTAHVAQSFPEWGFAVLNKGNNGGVIANAELEVKRGRNVVARLKVRNVEQAIAVADVIPGSVPRGYNVRSGDLVVAAPVTTPPPAPPVPGKSAAPGAPVAPGAPAPAPGMGAAADPFGSPAPAAAPAKPTPGDPFGSPAAPAPAAPAPAAPAPAAPAPAAPGTPAPKSADPFGEAPATAPPAGGATPPAGAGTKQSPSTADPFGK